MCHITTSTNLTLLGHIRNKFRGQNKRHNNISVLSFVLVGLREWETVQKSCDILYIYDEREIETFHSFPALKLDMLFKLRVQSFVSSSSSTTNHDADLFQFKDNTNDEYDDNMPTKSILSTTNTNTQSMLSTEDKIDIDDI
jgi:hypothetical protein